MIVLTAPLALLLLPAPLALARLLPPAPAATGGLRIPPAIAGRLAGPAAVLHRDRVLPAICWAALVLALAGPAGTLSTPGLPASGRDIVLVLDLSGSMEQPDFSLDGRPARRVDVVKRAAADFLRRRAGDRIGLVVFAENAYVAAPISYDLAGVRQALADLTIGLAGRSTAIGDGLGLAIKRLHAAPGPARLAVLLSDGSNNAGTVAPADAARLARAVGVRVDTIAFGTDQPIDGVPSDLDPAALAEIAAVSGGQTFRVRTTGELDAVYRAIDAMEGSPSPAPPAVIRRPLWTWPAALALVAALLMLAWPRWARR